MTTALGVIVAIVLLFVLAKVAPNIPARVTFA
jgi:hypothetical protein